MELDKEASAMRFIEKLVEHRVGVAAVAKVEKLAAKIGINETKLLELYVRAKNTISRSKFAAIPFSRRIVFLPQCLRSRDCPASLGEYGYVCKKCGRCGLQRIISKALGLGYKGAFILSGGTMVGRILKREKPSGCLGIACLKELVLGSFICEKFGTVPYCIALLRDGCVETNVDWGVVGQALSMSFDTV